MSVFKFLQAVTIFVFCLHTCKFTDYMASAVRKQLVILGSFGFSCMSLDVKKRQEFQQVSSVLSEHGRHSKAFYKFSCGIE